MNTTNETILDTLTDDERREVEIFIRDQRAAQGRAARARQMTDDFITRANERAASKVSPLDTPGHRGPGVRQ